MSGNCDKILLIPPTTNQWPQSHDHKVSMGGNSKVMEKPSEEHHVLQQQQQQQPLKCPRCDSSNTKFCYYNNYNLSQPRHFCKACKRYWTRGGTLRNVPVGGGCRKNKRLKRPLATTSSAIDTASSSSSSSAPTSASQPQIDTASTTNHINPLFYGLHSNSTDVSLPLFSTFTSGFDHLQMNNALGLDFTSGVSGNKNGYTNGFTSNNTLVSSNYSPIFSTSSSTCTSTTTVPIVPVMSSLLSSSLLQQKFMNGGRLKHGGGVDGNSFQQGLDLGPLEQMQMAGNGSEVGMVTLKDVKVELGQNQMEHAGLYDPSSSLYWNTATAMGIWNDSQANIGPSLTSLI
ncbi:hypothetical protein RJT34_13709 [Clitoria ternatea]|uniref:Dof zinc finger protein n=1 Tax=Clitoria ternatea TaxID=43366 RepID=A0AAN9JPF7_CLITE